VTKKERNQFVKKRPRFEKVFEIEKGSWSRKVCENQ